MYHLRCLGPPVLERDGTEVKFSRKKSLALLAYLAVTRHPQSRDSLGALLWPDQPPAPASGYLRTALYDINTACPDGLIDADRQTVRIAERTSLDVDVWKFRELVEGGRKRQPGRSRLAEAIGLFRGTFLSGFSLKDAPAFEDWQRESGEELAQTCEEALQDLIRACVSDGDTVEALALARRLVAMDELDEHYHRMLMSLEAIAGKPVAVDLAWQRCCRILKRELDAQPEEETRKLYDRVRSARGRTLDQRLIGELLGGLSGEVGTRRPAWAPARAAGPAVISATTAPRPPETIAPHGIAFDAQGRMYFVDGERRQVIRMEDFDGRGATALALDGTVPVQLGSPEPLCLDAKGRVYVADPGFDHIVRFDDMDGSGCVSLGTTGPGEGCFNGPTGVCVDARGRIFVADYGNHRIVRMDDMDGSGWLTLGGPKPGEGPGRFNQPYGVFVDPSGFIYVSVHPATVVRMNDIDGSGWVAIRPANLRLQHVRYTRGLTVDSERNAIYLVVGDTTYSVIRISGLTGLRWTALKAKPGASRSHPDLRDGMRMPARVCMDSRQRLYITDPGLHRIVRVDDIYGKGWVEYPPPVSAPAPGAS